MRQILGSTISLAMTPAAVSAVISLFIPATFAQTPAPSAATPAMTPALTTPWGDPDLQGIWLGETDTPLQRPAKYAGQEFFTDAQRAELDAQRAALGGKDNRKERGTELDVTGSYNDVFISRNHTGARTSRIVDPSNGRIPPLTLEAQKTAAGEREFRLALLQATETCKIWTVTQVFTPQSDEANRIYYEPRCNEGNYALPGLIRGARMEELAFAEGRGPHPATKDSATSISGAEDDPLQ